MRRAWKYGSLLLLAVCFAYFASTHHESGHKILPRIPTTRTQPTAPKVATEAQRKEPIATEKFSAEEFQQLANSMDQLSSDQSGDLAKVNMAAKQLNSVDAQNLTKISLDPKHGLNERYLAVYLLSLRAKDFWKELSEIAQEPFASPERQADPHGVATLKNSFEVAIRIRAIRALDSANAELTLGPIFSEIERSQRNHTLQRLAALAKRGALEGRPGLASFFDENNHE